MRTGTNEAWRGHDRQGAAPSNGRSRRSVRSSWRTAAASTAPTSRASRNARSATAPGRSPPRVRATPNTIAPSPPASRGSSVCITKSFARASSSSPSTAPTRPIAATTASTSSTPTWPVSPPIVTPSSSMATTPTIEATTVPGRQAAREFGVRSPLDEVDLAKDEIRELSRRAGLSTWDEPASACLSSRIPYHTEVTDEKLRIIERAEAGASSSRIPRLSRAPSRRARTGRDRPRRDGRGARARDARRHRARVEGRGLPLRHARSSGLPNRQPQRGPAAAAHAGAPQRRTRETRETPAFCLAVTSIAVRHLAWWFLLLHLPFLPRSLEDLDSINFALGSATSTSRSTSRIHPATRSTSSPENSSTPWCRTRPGPSDSSASLAARWASVLIALFTRIDVRGHRRWAASATLLTVTRRCTG